MTDDEKTREQLIDELTELHLQNTALKKSGSAEKYRSLVEKIRDVIYELDDQGVVLYISPAIRDMLGYDSAEIVGKNFIELAYKDDLSNLAEWFSELRKGKESPSEYRISNKSGELRWTRTKISPIMEDGMFKGARGILIDVTEQRRVGDALKDSENKYRLLAENSNDVIFVLDMNLNYTYVSPSIKILLGYEPAELLNQPAIETIALSSRDLATKIIFEALELQKSGQEALPISRMASLEMRRKDGTTVWAEVSASIIRDEHHRSMGILGVTRDITERKQTEDTVRQQTDAMDAAIDGIAILNEAGEFVYVNKAHDRLYGYETVGEMIGKSWRLLYDPDVLQHFEQEIMPELARKGGWHGETIGTKKNGSKFHQELSLTVMANGGLICVIRDITARKKYEEELKQSEERFRRIFDEGPFGMVLANPDYTIITVNKAFCGLLGYAEQELVGENITKFTYEEDRERSREISEQLFAGSIPMFRFQKRYVRKDGAILWVNLTISPIHGNKGNVIYTISIIEDLTEIRTATEKIHLLNYYDSLTGLPNRILYTELIKRAIQHAQRRKEMFALIYIGLDNLKRINDTFGYGIGDLLLKAVADRLVISIRKSDYVARLAEGETDAIISRVGGDEFIVLMHDIRQIEDAARTSRRLLKELSAPYDLSGREVFMTVSIGIALYPDDGTDVDDLLRNAEKAMRHTKNEGKNNYHFYSSSMHSSVLELLTLENDLHRAIERNELVLYYQPKVDTATRMVMGMEALIRWKHPDRGLVPPMQFIPMAETSGLILPIGEFVIRTVCKQIKTWQEAGYKPINIAMNVSSHQFEKQNLMEIVQAALQDTLISPQCLELEITESTIMRNPEKIIRILTELKALGIRISIDDFGTGYSSLSYLKRLPLDFLKIDQSFVKGLASDPRDQAIVRTTIVMAHSLSLKTIAEGVETEEQLSFMQKHGCDESQGYLFSRPLPAEEIPGILAKGYL